MSDVSYSAELIRAEQLSQTLDSDDLVILDVRYTPGKNDGKQRYLAGHIPGAIYVDLPTELSDAEVKGQGANPLPDIADFERNVRRWGISENTHIVVYDDTNLAPSARAWWLLRWAGLRRISLLNGGLNAWKKQNLPLATDDQLPVRTSAIKLRAGALTQLHIDEVSNAARHGLLLDLRPAAAFSINAEGQGGHIPGARSFPSARLLDEDGLLLSTPAIHARLKQENIDTTHTISAYCGSGVAAALLIFALETVGKKAALYPGSWSHWSSQPDRPIEG